MSQLYEPRLRPERLIAGGRVALAIASLFAVWLDVDEPVRFVALTYTVLTTFLVYSVVVAVVLWRADAVPRHWTVAVHAADLACCSLLIFCTEGPSSPFNSWFVFALLSATLRWRARGALWTAGAVLIAFAASAIYFGAILADPQFDMRAVIIRGVYLVVLAALLHYVGTQNQRTLHEMWGLARWPHHLPSDVETLARDLLQYTAGLMDAPTVSLQWSETGVEQLHAASWARGRWTYGPADAGQAPGGGLAAPLRGESCAGFLYVLGTDSTIDHQVLAEIVADVIAARLDAFYLSEQLRLSAATEERIRLARDLHDGVLQSFTGVALRLAAIQRQLSTDPVAARAAVDEAQRVLASEQRGLRFFIQELRPGRHTGDDDVSLQTRLRDLARLVELEWDLVVELQLSSPDNPPQADVARDLYHIVREALINAARHGGASHARITIAHTADDRVTITIADNGRGFPVYGRFTGADLAKSNFGPRTLRERVEARGGTLTLESSPDGATVRVVLPVGSPAGVGG